MYKYSRGILPVEEHWRTYYSSLLPSYKG